MRSEEKILRVVYGLVKGDTSPIHLPVAAEAVCQMVNLPFERVQACCKVLENHGYLVSSRGMQGPTYYYITKAGLAEAQKSSLTLHFYSAGAAFRRRA